MTGTTTDLSPDGVYVASPAVVAAGGTVDLRFALGAPELSGIPVRGRIAWVNSEAERRKPDYPVGFGVEFLEIADLARQIISRLGRSAPDGPPLAGRA